MPLPLLAYVGLGLGLGSYFNEQREASNKADEMRQKYNALWGSPPTLNGSPDGVGPVRPGVDQPLMSPGTGLMGGQITPMQFAQGMIPMGGEAGRFGKELAMSYMKAPTPWKGPSGWTEVSVGKDPKTGEELFKRAYLGPNNKLITEGEAYPKKSGVTINTGDIPFRGIPLTDIELKTYNAQPGSYWDKNGIVHAPAPSRTTEGEAKVFGQNEAAMFMIDDLNKAIESGNFDPSDPWAWAKHKASTIPVLSSIINLSPEEANTSSNVEQLSNLVLAAMRGAQVGPEEQELFNLQLPRFGQDKELFKANLANTKRNLEIMMKRIAYSRGVKVQDMIFEIWKDPETDDIWERTGIGKGPDVWRKRK